MTEAELEAMALARGGKVTRFGGEQSPGPIAEMAGISVHMSEKDFQAKVIAYAESRGWKVFHPYDSRKSTGEGYPDLTLVRATDVEAGIVLAELKDETGKLSKKQEAWRDAIIASNTEWHLWRPSDWPMIQEILK